MYKNKKILAMIPARGGSKGLLGKNVKPLFGKPLIAWTVHQALNSKLIDKVMVDTDSPKIAGIAKGYGAESPYLRPASLAGDKARIADVALHSLEYFEKKGEFFDYFLLLEPTSPIRMDGDIDRAIKKLVDAGNSADSLVSVGEIALEHPVYAKKMISGGLISPYFKSPAIIGNRQSLPKAYFPYGVVYLSKVSAIKRTRQVYGGRVVPMKIERWQNYEINDIWDLKCVEAVMREHGGFK